MHSALRPFTSDFSNFSAAAASYVNVAQNVVFLALLSGSRSSFFISIIALVAASVSVVAALHFLTQRRASNAATRYQPQTNQLATPVGDGNGDGENAVVDMPPPGEQRTLSDAAAIAAAAAAATSANRRPSAHSASAAATTSDQRALPGAIDDAAHS